MKIALLHYHLKTGGVTTVLRQQVAALREKCDFLILTGEPPEAPFPAPVIHIPGLAYDSVRQDTDSPQMVARAVDDAIHSHWASGCDVLHVHNPTLAKNHQLLKVLDRLHSGGTRLLLQIHDFAEDGRPAAYSHDPYPADCHYGVINSRDYHILEKAGLKPEGLHRMDNMVNPIHTRDTRPLPHEYMLYPIRALRRKNIGEAMLLSLFFPQNTPVAVTLPPNSAVDMESYNDWKKFAHQHGYNIAFDMGLKNDFNALVNGARLLITTSITEGFGFSFLEAWTAGKMLWGRSIVDICRDFTANGIRLDHLYTRLAIPLRWIDAAGFSERWRHAYARAAHKMGKEGNTSSSVFSRIVSDDLIDFGLLDEHEQRRVIHSLSEDPGRKKALISVNPFLTQAVDPSIDTERIAANQQAIAAAYSKTTFARRLAAIYHRVTAIEVKHCIDKSVLLDAFMQPEKFSLLKWGEYYG